MKLQSTSRRGFLGRASAAGAVLVATGGAAAAIEAADSEQAKRRVVGSSPYPTFSRATAFGGLVFVSGVVGRKTGTRDLAGADFESQCRQALDNLKASVEAAGSSMDKVLKCTCFLTDFADFSTFNKVYVRYFPSQPPARSTVVVKELVVPGAKLEIDCVTCLE